MKDPRTMSGLHPALLRWFTLQQTFAAALFRLESTLRRHRTLIVESSEADIAGEETLT